MSSPFYRKKMIYNYVLMLNSRMHYMYIYYHSTLYQCKNSAILYEICELTRDYFFTAPPNIFSLIICTLFSGQGAHHSVGKYLEIKHSSNILSLAQSDNIIWGHFMQYYNITRSHSLQLLQWESNVFQNSANIQVSS